MSKKHVLFLCTGNSARSQMAEGLTNHFWGANWQAFSAGTHPAGYLHPLAIEVMNELGIDISGQRSKGLDLFRHGHFDLVITVCDDAAKHCPVWLGEGYRHHVGFPDPAAAEGSRMERLHLFRTVRDGIKDRILTFLQQADANRT